MVIFDATLRMIKDIIMRFLVATVVQRRRVEAPRAAEYVVMNRFSTDGRDL
jgi:hypothetical protein